MDKLTKIIFLIIISFVLNSCGWFEQENIKEQTLSKGYKIFYDPNGLAYDYISILKINGNPLLNSCTEFYITEDFLYATVKDNDLAFFKIRNSDKKIFKILHNEYVKNMVNDGVIKYDSLKQ